MKKQQRDEIVGQRIVALRHLTATELEAEGWEDYAGEAATVIVLENGVVLYPSADEEGNGPGALFANAYGRTLLILPPAKPKKWERPAEPAKEEVK